MGRSVSISFEVTVVADQNYDINVFCNGPLVRYFVQIFHLMFSKERLYAESHWIVNWYNYVLQSHYQVVICLHTFSALSKVCKKVKVSPILKKA